MFESWFQKREVNVIEYRTAEDTSKIPFGFFTVIWPGGKRNRACRHKGLGELWHTPDAVMFKYGFVIPTDSTAVEKAKHGFVLPTDDELALRPIVRRHSAAPTSRDG